LSLKSLLRLILIAEQKLGDGRDAATGAAGAADAEMVTEEISH
jgi:hypothetical protein